MSSLYCATAILWDAVLGSRVTGFQNNRVSDQWLRLRKKMIGRRCTKKHPVFLKLVLDRLVGCEVSSWEGQWSVSLCFPLPCCQGLFKLWLQVSRGGFFSKLKSLTHTLMAYVETSSTPLAAFTTLAGTCSSFAAEVEGGFRPASYSVLMETMDLYTGGTMIVAGFFLYFFCDAHI